MAKFLQSRVEKGIATETDNRNLFTAPALRSLIPGNFYILDLQPQENTPLSAISKCFLLLHERGLFVLQQCHQSGIIHGEQEEESWTCFNYLGDGKSFENPVLQNKRNIQCLASVLKLPVSDFYSCVLFDNECELRRVPAATQMQTIIWADQVEQHFAALLPKLELRYSHTQLEALHDIFVLVSAEG